MRATQKFSETPLSLLLVLWATFLAASAQGQSFAGKVEVRGLMGSASYSMAGGAPVALALGMVVPVGSMVKTSAGAAVDLALSHKGGIVRLLQNSALSLDKFSATDATQGAVVDVQLHLMEGTMVGFDKKLSNPSRFQIKVAHGIVDMSGFKYRLDAQGYLVVVEGNALVAFVPPSGEPAPFELKTPPPAYFSPIEGVRPAPSELVREVVLQTKIGRA